MKGTVNCPCCGIGTLEPYLVTKLAEVEAQVREELVISSGYRCPYRNAAVGGAVASSHMGIPGEAKSSAADIYVVNNAFRFKLITALLAAGFRRIGVYAKHVHADLDSSRSQDVFWSA